MQISTSLNGDVIFYAKHPGLIDFAELLRSGLSLPHVIHPWTDRIDVFVGMHQFKADELPTGGFSVGIQTEQFFDAKGKQLWGIMSKRSIFRQILQYDAVLDLSESNRAAYQFLPKLLRRKITFGPFVFPDNDFVNAKDVSDERAVYVGTASDRRLEELKKLNGSVRVIQEAYGSDLSAELGGVASLANIHYQEGVYVEVPRFLLACHYGLVFCSEELPFPFQSGVHYLKLEDIPLAAARGSSLFEKINSDFRRKHRFRDFLSVVASSG